MNWRLPVMIIAVLCIGIRPLYAQSGDARAYLERGRVLAKAGKSTQALPYFLLALETAENRHGKDSPEILTMLESLAGQYAADRLFRDAEPLYRQSLGIQERAVTGQMAGLARTLNSLGAIYEATERMDQAREVYARVLRQVSPTLGADHPAVVAAHDRLVRMSKVAAPAPAAPPAPVVKAKAPPAPPPAPVPAAPPATVVKAKAPPAPPPPSPKAKPGYRIHLTSIRHRGDAGREWARLKRLYGALLADLELAVVRVDLGAPRGVYFRVQGGPLTRAGARGRCARFSARGVWCAIVRAATPQREVPVPPVVQARPSGSPAVTGYRIHLTSIRKRADAPGEWRRLKRLYGKLLRDLGLSVPRVDLGPRRGIYFRIEGGPLSRADARALCAAFAKRGVWCRVVPPGEDRVDSGQRTPSQQVRRRGPVRERGPRRKWARCRRTRRRALASDRGCRRVPLFLPGDGRFAPTSSRGFPRVSLPQCFLRRAPHESGDDKARAFRHDLGLVKQRTGEEDPVSRRRIIDRVRELGKPNAATLVLSRVQIDG